MSTVKVAWYVIEPGTRSHYSRQKSWIVLRGQPTGSCMLIVLDYSCCVVLGSGLAKLGPAMNGFQQ